MYNSKNIKLLDSINVKLLERANQFVETYLTYEVFHYQYYGDEVVDTSQDVKVKMKIPCIQFLDMFDFLQNLKREGFRYLHYYKKTLKPYDTEILISESDVETYGGVWNYFDSIKNNTLRSGITTYISIFYVAEFEVFFVLRITNVKSKLLKNYLEVSV